MTTELYERISAFVEDHMDEFDGMELHKDLMEYRIDATKNTWRFCPKCGYDLNNPLYIYKEAP